MSRPTMSVLKCGTYDSLKRNPGVLDGYHAISGSLYVNKTGMLVITSQEWVDWLVGKTEYAPSEDVTPILLEDFAAILNSEEDD